MLLRISPDLCFRRLKPFFRYIWHLSITNINISDTLFFFFVWSKNLNSPNGRGLYFLQDYWFALSCCLPAIKHYTSLRLTNIANRVIFTPRQMRTGKNQLIITTRAVSGFIALNVICHPKKIAAICTLKQKQGWRIYMVSILRTALPLTGKAKDFSSMP